MTAVAERCATGGAHTWSEWRYDESVAGAVKECTTCRVCIDRTRQIVSSRTVATVPVAPSASVTTAGASTPLDALGRTPFTEELRGDFAQAAALADAQLASSDASTRADALLMRAWVHVLQGEITRARTLLDRVLADYGEDANVRLRALSHLLNATHHQYNLFPDRTGVGSTEISARWSGAQELLPIDTRWQTARAQATSGAALLEADLTYSVISQLLPARYMLDARRTAPSEQTDAQALTLALSHPGTLRHIGTTVPWQPFVAYADVLEADMRRRAGEHDAALSLLERARARYRSLGDTVGDAMCLMMGAEWACARFSSPVIWNFAMVDSAGPSNALSVQLEALEGDTPPTPEERAACAAAYDRAERAFAEAGARRGMGAIALRRGFLAACSHQEWSEVASHAVAARDHFAAAGDHLNAMLATTHIVMAELCGAHAGHDVMALAASIGTWGQASGSISFALGCGILLNRLSRDWLTRGGQTERALQCSAAARALFQALDARINAAQCLVDSGMAHAAVGMRPAALTCYEAALDEYAALVATHPSQATILRQRVVLLTADVYQLALQDTNADAMERSAARMAAQLESLPRTADLMAAMQDMQRRIAALQSGQSLDPAVPELDPDLLVLVPMAKLAESIVQNSAVLAPVYRSRTSRAAGDDATVQRLLQQAMVAADQLQSGERDMLRAVVFAEQKDLPAAASAMRAYIEAGGANAGVAGELTQVMQQGSRAGAAETALQQRRSHEQAFAAFVMVEAYDDAAMHLQELERLYGAEWWRDDPRPWLPLSNIAELHERRGVQDKARDYYVRAVDALEQRRSSLTQDELKVALASERGVQYLYLMAARAMVQQGDISAGFAFAERAKSRALLDLMATSRAPVPGAEGPEMARWRELGMALQVTRGLLAIARAQAQPDQARIAALQLQLQETDARQRDAERALALVNPRFRDAVSASASVIDLDGVRAALPDGTLLLEYFFVGEELLAWAVMPGGQPMAHVAHTDTNMIARDIAALHRAIDDGAPWRDIAGRLSDVLLRPFAALLRTARDLIIVPHGITRVLPFHVLPLDGTLLADSHTISYLPSASTLHWLSDRAPDPRPRDVLVIGNPRLDLPESVIEARYVAAQFAQPTLLLEQDATEAAVRAALPSATVVHFATHGVLDEAMPLNSALLLADGDELTVYEMMLLRLQARLVVLSACSTGRGERTGGDDVLGLTRALLAAGAESAVVSLWPVDDHATALFMHTFYDAIAQGTAPRKAMQTAQQSLRRMTLEEIEVARSGAAVTTNATVSIPPDDGAFRHPYFWAPFQLVGR